MVAIKNNIGFEYFSVSGSTESIDEGVYVYFLAGVTEWCER